MHLAVSNGRFYVSGAKDYIYISNTAYITRRSYYFDVRAMSYIDVIAEIILLGKLEQNKKIKVFLYRYALMEARNFLGLYWKEVQDKQIVRTRILETSTQPCMINRAMFETQSY